MTTEPTRAGFRDWYVLYQYTDKGEIRIRHFKTKREADIFVKSFEADMLEFTKHNR